MPNVTTDSRHGAGLMLPQINRDCPLCRSADRRMLCNLPARCFGQANPTYREDYCRIIGVDPELLFPLVRCNTCGFDYAGWLPDAGFLQRVYEDAIDHSKTMTGTLIFREDLLSFAAFVLRAAMRYLNYRPRPLKLLDYGCGYGRLLGMIAMREVTSVGYEPSSIRAEQAAQGALIVDTIEAVHQRGPYDIVVCTEVLEHVPDPVDTIGFFRSQMAPNGLLAITVPNAGGLKMDTHLSAFLNTGQLDRVVNLWEHLNYFDPQTIRIALSRHGFQVTQDYEDYLASATLGFIPSFRGIRQLKNIAGVLARGVRFSRTGSGSTRILAVA